MYEDIVEFTQIARFIENVPQALKTICPKIHLHARLRLRPWTYLCNGERPNG